MNLTDLPNAPTGSHPLVNWLRRLRLAVQRRTLRPGLGYKIRETADGYTLEILPGSGGATQVGGGMNYRGQWSPTPASPYLEFDVVILLTGTAQGTYLSVTNNNSNPPDTGIGWVQIAPGYNMGRWS